MPFFGRRQQRSSSYDDGRSSHSAPNFPPPPYEPYQTLHIPPPHDPYSQQAWKYPAQQPQRPMSSTTNLALRPRPHTANEPHVAVPTSNWTSCTHLPTTTPCPIYNATATYLNLIGDKFSDVISHIDEELFPGSDRDLIFTFDQWPSPSPSPPQYNAQLTPQHSGSRDKKRPPLPSRGHTNEQPRSIHVKSKVAIYANSRLPTQLPPLQVYMPTWPLLCLAAQYSNTAYMKPASTERDIFVSADSRTGTKAMVIKSVPLDAKNTIIFAIRGTSLLNPRDWGVNWQTDPVSPAGFLDDEGNLAHAGFLKCAKAMVNPIAVRLRHLLEENPSRAACSLLITGHSAGGAVAALLYAHMLSESVHSELTNLTACFKRIHCVTFGAPPISLLPLSKPPYSERRLRKSLFLSFINEGDPVVRAEKAYVKSLVELLASCPPRIAHANRNHQLLWKVPPATLSNPGRLVVLREVRSPKRGELDVEACVVTDEVLRGVIFGDPLMHKMGVYCTRIERLTVKAATGKLMS